MECPKEDVEWLCFGFFVLERPPGIGKADTGT
jgi:hypothetical protein